MDTQIEIKKSLDFVKPLKAMKLEDDMRAKLVFRHNLIAECFKVAFDDKKCYEDLENIINTAKSMAKDNFEIVADVFGNDLTKQIINF